MTRDKLIVFFYVYYDKNWVTSKQIISNEISIRSIRRHLLGLSEEGVLLRVKSFGGYRYKVNPKMDISNIFKWSKLFGMNHKEIV